MHPYMKKKRKKKKKKNGTYPGAKKNVSYSADTSGWQRLCGPGKLDSIEVKNKTCFKLIQN